MNKRNKRKSEHQVKFSCYFYFYFYTTISSTWDKKKDFSKISDNFGINFEQINKELKTEKNDDIRTNEVLKMAEIDKLDFHNPEKSKNEYF